MPDADFAAIVAAAVDTYGVPSDRLCDRFAINRSTLSRWKNGKSAPQPFARELVFNWIKDNVRDRIMLF
jgi:DNA-binding transcriptional regulator YiaG